MDLWGNSFFDLDNPDFTKQETLTKGKTVFQITQSTPKSLTKIYDEKIKNEDIEVIQFEPRAIYSLDPRQEAGRLLALDKNDETLSKIEE